MKKLIITTTHLIAMLFLPSLVACSSTLKVQSDPTGAEAFIRQQNGTEKKPIGKTPIEIPFTELYQKAGGSASEGEYLVLTLENKDFETKEVLIPPHTFGNQTSLVQVKMQSSKDAVNASQILTRLHNAQKFAQSAQFERAHIETDKALEVDSQFVRAISLKGSIYYLQKNYSEALKWFEKALTIDPSFDEAVKMIAKIKQEAGQGKKQ